MIQSFRCDETCDLFTTRETSLWVEGRIVALRTLDQLEAATSLDDLRIPSGNGCSSFKHDLNGQHSMQISKKWRLCCVWQEDGPHQVEIVDITDHVKSRQGAPKMTIKRPVTGWTIKDLTTHPGTVLNEDFLKPMGISANRLALQTRMPPTRIGQILRSRRSVSTDTALRLARFFGNSPEFWLNLQAAYDLSKARMELDSTIQRDVEPLKLEAVGA